MIARCLILLLLLNGAISSLWGQHLPSDRDFFSSGKLFVSVDDRANISYNGKHFYTASLQEKTGESTSPPLVLRAGDRLVVHLTNIKGPRHFLMTFVSDDRQFAINFTYLSFKLLSDPDIKDFTVDQFNRLPKHAKKETKKHAKPLFGATSDWVWGEAEDCVLGCLITPDMFKPLAKQ